MDLHKADDYDVKPTIEEIKRNHIADLETQEKYNVRFIQYWINEEAGLVFCMMEAPDRESCIATHRAAHGNMACNIIELKGGDYKTFLEGGKVNKFDITEDLHGAFDSGSRSFLVADVFSLSTSVFEFQRLKDIARQFMGREVSFDNGRIRFVFNSAASAIECATGFLQEINLRSGTSTEICMAISTGAPVTHHENIFAEALQLGECLCDVTFNRQVSISAESLASHSGHVPGNVDGVEIRSRTVGEQQFLSNLTAALEPVIFTEQFSISELCKRIGVSQAQLYRKTTSITGLSPNALVQEIRLKKSLRLLRQGSGNISQVAFASGFNSASYFTRCFTKRFGIPPTSVSKSE
jgi:AraC-like DNA-binding protein